MPPGPPRYNLKPQITGFVLKPSFRGSALGRSTVAARLIKRTQVVRCSSAPEPEKRKRARMKILSRATG